MIRQRNLSKYALNLGWESHELTLTENELVEEAILGSKLHLNTINVVFIDLDPRYVELNKISILNFLNFLKLNQIKTVLFEVDIQNSMKNSLRNFDFDLVVCPYVNLGAQKRNRNLSGFGLSVFSLELETSRELRKLRSSNFAEILITCGGSDPLGITLLYLNALESYWHADLAVNVVIGELFDPNLIDLIYNFSLVSKLDLRIIRSPKSITEYLEAAKFVLTTGGLTRTESIFMGVPAVVVDIDLRQFNSTKLFSEIGAVFSLGLFDSKDTSGIQLNLRNFLFEVQSTEEKLQAISESARLAIPGNGSPLILKEFDNHV